MKSIYKKWLFQNKYYLLILAAVLLFFLPVFRGQIPFPGDLLVNENPYKESSYFGFVPGSYPYKAQGADVIKEIYPWRFFSIESLKKGQIPFWNPYNFSGNPQLANFQTAVFYPLTLLYFILPFNIAWTILIMLQPIMAGVFMYLFLTKGLKLSGFASFIGGIAFAFSSYMTVWIEYGNIGHTILCLPLVLLFTKRLYEKINISNFLGISICLTMSLLAGYIQGLFYIYAFCFLYFIYLSRLKDFRKLLLFLLASVLPLFLGAFQILPTLELFNQSTRGSYTLAQISSLLLPLKSWITIFASDFFGNPATRNYYLPGTYIERVIYVGIPILFFAFYSLKSKFKEKKLFVSLVVLSLLIANNLPFINLFYLLPIPVISTTVPTRELSIFAFSVIILAAFGIDHWERGKDKSKSHYLFILAYISLWIGLVTLLKLGLINADNFKVTTRNLVLPSVLAMFTLIAFSLKNNFGKILLTGLVLIDLLYFFNKITPFSPAQLIYPETPVISFIREHAGINRFWGYGSAYIPANFQTFDRTYSPEGNDPLHISSYGKLLVSSGNGKLPKVLPRPDANIAPGYGEQDLKHNFYRKRILDLLGVKYILNKADRLDLDTFPADSYKMVWTDNIWQIYENKNVISRFFMANDYLVFPKENDILKNIYNENIDLSKTLLLDEKPGLPIDKNSQNSIDLLSYSPNYVSLKTNSSGNSLVFLSDNYYPEWQAFVDGKQTKILLADYTFRAVAVPEGSHKVEFVYMPDSFVKGLKIALAGFIFLLGILFWIKKYEEK